jgi:TonB family protein
MEGSMSESTARAERFDASSPASYLWQIPGKPVAVRISLELVERLEHEVVENFRSLNSRGSEIGGVLLGSISGSGPAKVSIDAYELIACDYSRGPLYRFSEADMERFRHAVEPRRTGNGLRVVGFFRSHTRKGLSLDAEDVTFFSEHFRDPNQIALLIRPYASKASTAGIFIWENGTVRGDASYREFPFRRPDLEHGAGNESAGSSEETPAPSAAAPPEPPKSPTRAQIVPIASRREIALPPPPEPAAVETKAPPAPEPRSHAIEKAPLSPPSTKASPAEKPATAAEKAREAEALRAPGKPKPGKLMWIAGGSAAALLLLSGMLVYPGILHKSKRSAITGPGSALSLRVERSQGELLLTWNRDSEAIKNASRAVLSISDGDQHDNVNMDQGQLQNGSIVYSPTSSDVVFQLSITGKDSSQTQSESVRVLRTRPSPMPDNPAPGDKTTVAGLHPGVAGAPAVSGSQPDPATPEQPEPKPVALSTPLKPFVAETPAQRLRPARPSDLPDAPRLGGAEQATVTLPGMNLAPPAPMPAPPQAAPAPLAAPTKLGGQVQQAEVVSRTNPEYPLAARQARVQGSVVVLAAVGPDGRIKSARALSGPPLLESSAVAAVKRWIYKPATLNGAPIDSETRVELKFTLGR